MPLAHALIVALAALSSPALMPPDDPVAVDPETITRPDWADKPAPRYASRSYPQALAEDGRGGEGALLCRAGGKGELLDCRVRSEAPANMGIAKAMLDLAPNYRLKPIDANGRPTLGRPVLLSINFRAPTISIHADHGWAVQQDPYGWESAYPKPALAAGVSGEAVVECRGASGKKSATCTVVSDAPAGQGFGAAALDLRARILTKPPAAGAASADHTVRLTVTFHAPPKTKTSWSRWSAAGVGG